MPTTPAYGVYNSQLIRYSRGCILYSDRILITKLLNQGFLKNRLVLSDKKFFGRYQHLIEKYCQLRTDDKKMVLAIRFWFKES